MQRDMIACSSISKASPGSKLITNLAEKLCQVKPWFPLFDAYFKAYIKHLRAKMACCPLTQFPGRWM